MMTTTTSYSRILAVWMVLLAFSCGVILPSVCLAKVDMTIATEGDPRDGLDCAGGGGDPGVAENKNISTNVGHDHLFIQWNSNVAGPDSEFIFIPFWSNNSLSFFVFGIRSENFHGRKIR